MPNTSLMVKWIDIRLIKLVVKGYTQQVGFSDTFSLVGKLTIVRLLLIIVAMKNWSL